MPATMNNSASFQAWTNLGDTLLVGEGNLSFANNLIKLPFLGITNLIATTFEGKKKLNEIGQKNIHDLNRAGVDILHNIDATKLDRTFTQAYKFDTIIFQFPNVGSREAKYGRNPNYVMIRKFLQSAKMFLSETGKILITTVDSPYYEGVFQFAEAAEYAGYQQPKTFPFDPEMFPDYSHINTNDQESAIKDHGVFLTWVFQPQA